VVRPDLRGPVERLERRLGRERRARRLAEEIAEQATRDALHDPLTGLPNRALLMDRLSSALARAAEHRAPLAVLFLDLDRFKLINDTLGHAAGDRLLMEVASRLGTCVRPTDTVARLGGDEFAIVCEGAGSEAAAELVAARIAETIGQPVVFEGVELSVSASIGIALADGSETPETLLRNGDTAMYSAKRQGGSFVFFSEADRVRDLRRLHTESDLRHAIERGELFLDYQPVLSVSTSQVVGVEALVRWRHPSRGVLRPDLFIPLAEETGLIVSIGSWVLAEACRVVGAWSRAGAALELSLNVSPRQLDDDDLATTVDSALRGAGLPASALWLELTESALLEESSPNRLAELTALGVRIAIDDFGTGYSPLTNLRHVPARRLKVDRSFIRGLESQGHDRAIVGGVVGLAHAMELSVVAEGVETAAQLEQVHELGCDLAQGFYLSPPLPAELIEDRYLAEVPTRLRVVS
jgi:diguanylate cyclase (GGDEF)-like protein